ncbi:type VI secretion system baseplate subunit TssF [Vibrio profundum]|uniref:type VI secretion system baseplate subunit TssF n=1 Tax=Vibrio profundum TaxID=2910247 RepID=UPI003D0F9425
MSSTKYYQDELSYLREAGNEFTKYHPKLTQFLSEGTRDPDVERLLEGFAFLTGRIREKIDDEIPEVTSSLMNLLWPHYMRSVPSMCISEFSSNSASETDKSTIVRGTEMSSRQIEGTACRFRTCYDVELLPMAVKKVVQTNTRSRSTIDMTFKVNEGLDFPSMDIDHLRLFIHGELHISRTLYLWLFKYLDYIELDLGDEYKHKLSPEHLAPVGFGEGEALLPYSSNSFSGYRLLQEYFSLPEKFMFFDIKKLDWLKGVPNRTNLVVSFVFKRALPDEVKINERHLRLHCTPAVNLFATEADPIRLEHQRNEYKVRPQSNNQDHYEVYSIEGVESWNKQERKRKAIAQFESFDHQINQRDKREFYKSSVRERISGRGLEHYISFHTHSNKLAELGTETVLIKLLSSNARLAERLSAGEISEPTHNTLGHITFANITKPTQSVSPQVSGELHWQLIANMSLNYMSLSNIDVLKVLLSTYDFHARVDRQAYRASLHRLDGIKKSGIKSIDRIFRGVPVRGNLISLVLNSTHFVNEGEMFLLANVLNEFIRLYSSVNSFTELEVLDENTGEKYQWVSALGQQTIL